MRILAPLKSALVAVHVAAVLAATALPFAAQAQAQAQAQPQFQLMMVEQAGCVYCAAWHGEVGPEYPKTTEGKAAPLVLQDLRSAVPAGITLARPPVFTPTFILLQNGTEIARLEGYPGEDFFWPLLGNMLQAAQN